MKKTWLAFILLLAVPAAYAQLDWSVTDQRCGNGILDKYELCEKGVNFSRCDQLAENLDIAMNCHWQHCTCVPRVNPTYCGNGRRDFFEMCDKGDLDDRCDDLGAIMNLSLVCNQKTCGCSINQTLDSDYNPAVVEDLVAKSQTPSVCGDKKVERNEDCDPPNTLCTTIFKEAGVCTDKCKCVTPEELAEQEKPKNETVQTETNISEIQEINQTEPVNETTSNETEKEGFFSRIISWFVNLFK
jgi:hypothetical protein